MVARCIPVTEKRAFTPAEFAALFGREKTWTYRLLYAGKINGISDYGRMMIPASEAVRIESEGKRYLGRRNAAKKSVPKKMARKEPKSPATGAVPWVAWVEKRRNKTGRAKGIGGKTKPSQPTAKKNGSRPP